VNVERKYVTGTGQLIRNVHAAENCTGAFCVIHRPCPGPWDGWPTHWRGDAVLWGIQLDTWRGFERICPHRVGHPAVEQLQRGHDGIHGCDGCPCSPASCEEIVENGKLIGYKRKEDRERNIPGGS
jgi:hypothetical protein